MRLFAILAVQQCKLKVQVNDMRSMMKSAGLKLEKCPIPVDEDGMIELDVKKHEFDVKVEMKRCKLQCQNGYYRKNPKSLELICMPTYWNQDRGRLNIDQILCRSRPS